MTYDEAIEELRSCAGTQFDPQFVELFAEQLAVSEAV
jgi:HD-GYP domain-containing protein (c-di-GMP phosphodiesterase class II)